MIEVLALSLEDPEGGYNVVDCRDGERIAWEAERSSANDLAMYLNSTYGALPPARDSLVFEVLVYRILGGPVLSLESALTIRRISTDCPDYIPAGPGWEVAA